MAEIKIYWAGDSTVKENTCFSFPQTGMGQAFGLFVKRNVRIVNCAQNGRSTKSFIDEGRLDFIDRKISKGDFLFIQFGHNDEKPDEARHTEPYGSYQENLKRFIKTAQAHGAHPLLITPIYRRLFKEDKRTLQEKVHLDYPEAMLKLGMEMGVPAVDMNTLSAGLIEAAGYEATKKWFLHVEPGKYDAFPQGKEDNSHLQYEGAYRFSRLLAGEIEKLGGAYKALLLEKAQEEEDPALLID